MLETVWANTTYKLSVAADEFGALFDCEDVSDAIVLFADGEPVYASKAVLVARSPYFKSLISFNTKMTALKELAAQKCKIDWTEHNADVARELLRFLYTGQCSVHDKHVDELLDLAAQVFVQTQRFELLLSAVMEGMQDASKRIWLRLTGSEATVILQRLFKHADSLPAGSSVVRNTLHLLGDAKRVWNRMFAVPMPVVIEVLKMTQTSQQMSLLKEVDERTVHSMLHWVIQDTAIIKDGISAAAVPRSASISTGLAEQILNASIKLHCQTASWVAPTTTLKLQASQHTKMIFDLLTWCCANSTNLSHSFSKMIQSNSFLGLTLVDPRIISEYIEPMGALTPEQLLDVYRNQASKSYPVYISQG
jgi:BTB/POZ domain